MADKKALIILAPGASMAAPGAGLDSFRKKAAILTSFTPGEVLGVAVQAEAVTPVTAETVAHHLEAGKELMVLDLGDDTSSLDAALSGVLDAMDRKTVVALVTGDALAFYGTGINAKAGQVARAARSEDVIPTLAYITDVPLTDACTGAVLYQVLKNPNLKGAEIAKLKEAISRLEGALARDNREPWDKHDCA